MNTLYAAAAKVDITPYLVHGTYLAGFGPNRLATGVLDPLTARVLYLEDENGPAVWIAADLIGFLLDDTDNLRRRLRAFAPERVMICSTHTHSGPDTIGLWGPAVKGVPIKSGRAPEYMKWMSDQIVGAVRRAQNRKRPAVIGFGEETSDKSKWVVNIRRHGYNDKTMGVMRVDGVDGRPIACLTNFACHPEILWEDNTKISPDFVHHLHKRVEEETGAVSLFFNGALGGMVTGNLDDDTGYSERKSYYRKMGGALGELAASTWDTVQPAPVKQIIHRTKRLWVSIENPHFLFMTNLGLFERKLQRNEIETSIDFWQIGSAQFVTMPGEALPSVGFAVKDRMGGDPNFLFGLANDEVGYILSTTEAADPNYKYERSMSLGPVATEMFLDTIASLVSDK